ncbi:cytochrome P450 [Saccharopolyspora phatthalungensis]|uniref:Cytochrome P450 n=1 Tax=Saccharopolyspora phatthalungensis TaxID=664693 RepID=A0A840Q301_9PSEU|nr:cytochrome P450 [Saccharopolyspora phatthalungensis]MBB5153128.1 cytochrome P450 [Saccharopolyspora phatthalungensis]
MTDQLAATDTAHPLPRTCPFSPPPEYVRLRAERPVTKVRMVGGGTAWLVTRHEDVRKLLADPRMSSDRTRPGFPRLAAGRQPPDAIIAPSLIGMDPPAHTAARRAVLGEFTVRRIEAMRPRIQDIVDSCVDDLLATSRPADLVHTVSLPVPSLVICELLGVPYADHDFFQRHTAMIIQRSGSDVQHAFTEIRSYLDELVTAKERDEPDDLLGRQIRKQRETGEPDHDSLVSLALLLLIAGHDSTGNMIALGTLALLENPDQRAQIVADPSRTPAAVEELLRYFTIAQAATSRTALADIEIGGVRIRAGEGVVALALAANHDPEVFDRPDELDLTRSARQHVAFGFGPHQCIGQNLARLELQIVFDTLFRRVPGLRLATAVEDLPFKQDGTVYGVHELPVTW